MCITVIPLPYSPEYSISFTTLPSEEAAPSEPDDTIDTSHPCQFPKAPVSFPGLLHNSMKTKPSIVAFVARESVRPQYQFSLRPCLSTLHSIASCPQAKLFSCLYRVSPYTYPQGKLIFSPCMNQPCRHNHISTSTMLVTKIMKARTEKQSVQRVFRFSLF